MLPLKAMLIIFVVLCFNSQVNSNPRVKVTIFNFGMELVIAGKNYIDGNSIAYGICQSHTSRKIITCRLTLNVDVFNYGEEPLVCDIKVKSQVQGGHLEIIGVTIWGKDKVIFTARDIRLSQMHRSIIYVLTTNMIDCLSTMEIVTVDNGRGIIPQVFVIPYGNKYTLVYEDSTVCQDKLCKKIVYADGISSAPIKWFANEVVIHSIEAVEHDPNGYFIVSLQKTEEGNLRAKYILGIEEGMMELGRSDGIEVFGWSPRNHFAAFCSETNCGIYNIQGKLQCVKEFDKDLNPIKYAAMYNLPGNVTLAMVCDKPQRKGQETFYRIIKISKKGVLEFSYRLGDLPCWRKYALFSAQFYMKTDTEYCLSLFHSNYLLTDWGNFKSYCFDI